MTKLNQHHEDVTAAALEIQRELREANRTLAESVTAFNVPETVIHQLARPIHRAKRAALWIENAAAAMRSQESDHSKPYPEKNEP